MTTNAISDHGTHLRSLGLGSALAMAASLLVGGCYEGSLARDAEEEIEEEDDLDVEPIEATCGPTMHVFPVGDAHNIGYDSTCNDNNCDISCPDLHANSDWNGPAGHHGIDVFAYRGAPLVAVTGGTIQRVGTPSATSGLRVRLRDDCGWEYYYGHLESAAVVEGQRVEAGQLIGTMGNSGTGGVHLHFNISPDGGYSNDINPFDLLKATSPTACGGSEPPAPEPQPEPQPPAGECDSVLAPDEALYRNQAISSCNGQYTLVMQEDGNVVLYDLMGTPLWHTYTHGTAAEALVMQSDGNFVLYDGVGNALWHTGTHGHPGAAMRVEEDGNVIVWEGWTAIWKAR
jgi:hypothetical protein